MRVDELESAVRTVCEPIANKPPDEQILVLVLGFLMAPLFLIVPLMVSAVIAADAFAGEKERRTIEATLNLPISDRDLFIAKTLGSFLPAVVVSWVGFFCYAVIANTIAWPITDRIFVPTRLWLGGVISRQRDLPLITRLVQRVRACAATPAILVCVDGLASYVTAFLKIFREPIHTGRRGRP